ncbi:MAG: D-glycero-beta-D-manno-heptose-7-phosphate kinase [Leptospiraceae bacterium]|nr:D-glycero-beta-D-manno-heptose-7-phosphate kinase [Leptospiraceae bacterium]
MTNVSKKIIVLGDIILDKYYLGNVKRISPEAPVPVVEVKDIEVTLGGAANVVNNLSALNVESILCGRVGRDESAKILNSILEEKKIGMELVYSNEPTTTKIRVVGGRQQICRIDFETIIELEKNSQAELFEKIFTNYSLGAIVISDYGKGVCTEEFCELIIKKANQKSIPVFIDPKKNDWNCYRNSFMITPNLKELSDYVAKEISNDDTIIEQYGRKVLEKLNLQNLLITRSEKGMSLLTQKETHHVNATAKEVFDVSGAGDTVIAVIAACISSGKNPLESAKIANFAGGIVVGKFGTTPIYYSEIKDLVSW